MRLNAKRSAGCGRVLSLRSEHQRGAALLLMLLIVIVASTSVLIVKLDRKSLALRQMQNTHEVLARAKAALLDYALLNPDLATDRAHSLPCPDIDSTGGFADGVAHRTACRTPGETVIGRLPWRTLGIEDLRDTSSACLWYIVSGNYKDAAVAGATLLNSDSNGQLQLVEVASGATLLGLLPEDRPVAVVLAAMRPVANQIRSAQTVGACGTLAASNYLDADAASGVSNAVLSGIADSIDAIAMSAVTTDTHNDRIVTISQRDIASRVEGRPDFLPRMRALGLAVTRCVANFGATQPAGATDKRLPWPAPVALPDYRTAANYDDSNGGALAGRLADTVNDSSSATGHALTRVLSDCDSVAVPEFTAAQMTLWEHWKDHFFYAVSSEFAPNAAVPSSCSVCLTVNAAVADYAAVVVFSGTRITALAQTRREPPIDIDTKQVVSNYLEGQNATNLLSGGTATNYQSQVATPSFNDLLFCIDVNLVVTEC